MRHAVNEPTSSTSNVHLLLGYLADLELEVDRLRKHAQVVQLEARDTLKRILRLSAAVPTEQPLTGSIAEIHQIAEQALTVLRDLREPSGYHPAHDQVISIAVRPLAEQVFRWQQRLMGAAQVVLRLELESEYVEWFPARLRNILDNLISNALRYRTPDEGEAWVLLRLRTSPKGYELRVADNRVGLRPREQDELFELFYRAAPVRAAGHGVGLAVVKMLVEQSGGNLTVEYSTGQGTTFVAVLPRYDLDDFLT